MQEYNKAMWIEHKYKRHNVSCLLYHFVCPIKNRRKVLKNEKRENDLKEICKKIEENYEIYFLEVWSDLDHVHFLIQGVPDMKVSNIITIIKILSWKEMFLRNPELRNELMWWKFWTSWYYVNTVWMYWSEKTIREYVKKQWKEKEYKKIFECQLKIF